MNPDQHPSLDDQMAEAVRLQREHVIASHAVDRRGWTRQQWVDDARRLFEDLHGSVLDLVNGHIVYMLNEIDYLRAALELADEERREIATDSRAERAADAASRYQESADGD